MQTHNSSHIPWARGLFRLCVASIVLLATACSSGEDAPISYHLRGVVKDVAGTGPDARVTIHHEAMPHFKDRDGHDAPMASMTMNFGFVSSIAATRFVVNDKIAFDFDVRFSQTPPLLITQLQTLPTVTQLTLAGD